jgi:hypothetical protein
MPVISQQNPIFSVFKVRNNFPSYALFTCYQFVCVIGRAVDHIHYKSPSFVVNLGPAFHEAAILPSHGKISAAVPDAKRQFLLDGKRRQRGLGVSPS